jgi:preprotein translocase subunit SecE
VTWPSRKDVLGSTLVVVLAVFIIAGFLGIVDFGLSLVVGSLMK